MIFKETENFTNRVIILGCKNEIDDEGKAHLSARGVLRAVAFLNYFNTARNFMQKKDGFDPLIVCSGGYAGIYGEEKPEDKTQSQGYVMCDYLVENGVPSKVIENDVEKEVSKVEDESSTTLGNWIYSTQKGLLLPVLYNKKHPLGVVTGRRHQRRSDWCAKRVGFQPDALLHINSVESQSLVGELGRFALMRTMQIGVRKPETMIARDRLLPEIGHSVISAPGEVVRAGKKVLKSH